MSTYRQIFKSTALIGGTQVLTLLIGIARTKALALWLGPAGMGLAGLYLSATGLIGTITGLGIGSSGVRQIAEAAGSGDGKKLARTVAALRAAALVSSLAGMLIIVGLCRPLSRATFGKLDYAGDLALVSLTLLCGGVSAGQIALLQGLRRLKDMAAAQVLGAAFGAVVSVTLVFFLRERGVAWFLVAISLFGVLTSWWYARKVKIEKVPIGLGQILTETRGLLSMGFAFMTAGLASAGSSYLTRVLITHRLGLDSAGLYQATWTLSTYYVGFVLSAMGADFCPRLTGVATDNATVNHMVNEQVETGVLIALPGVLATLVLAPWVLSLFYSKAFVAAATLVRWQAIGVFLRVVSWPLAMVLIAKGKSGLYMGTEIVSAALGLALLFGSMRAWGLEGVGVAFAASYILYTATMWAVCHRVSGFSWSRGSRKIVGASCALVLLAFLTSRLLPEPWASGGGALLTLLGGLASFVGLQRLLNIDLLKTVKQKLKWRLAT